LPELGPQGLAANRSSSHVAFAETLEFVGPRLGFFGFCRQLFVTSPVFFAGRFGLLHVGRGPRTATAPNANEAEDQQEPQRPDEPRALHEFLAPY
jgi:hypothetical protein